MKEENKNKNDEIDLIEIFINVQKWASKKLHQLSQFLLKSIIFIVEKKWHLAIYLLLGTLISFGLYHYNPRYYYSECTIKNNGFNNYNLYQFLNRINEQFQSNNLGDLSKDFDIAETELNAIKSFNAYFAIDNNKDRNIDFIDYSEKDTALFKYRMQNILVLGIKSKTNIDLSKIELKLNNYIKSNPLFIKQNEIRVKQTKEIRDLYVAELEKLTKLQDKEYFEESEPKSNGQLILTNDKDRQLYYKNIIELKEQIQKTEREIELYNTPVTVIQSFSPWTKPENGLLFYLKSIIPLSLLLGLFQLLLFSYTKKIKYLMLKQEPKLKKAS